MGSTPVEWGDVPTWLQAIGGLAQVGHVVWTIQVQRAKSYVDGLRSELGLDDEAIAEQIAERPELAALVMEGIERGMHAREDEKRWLLAKVVASAFAGDDARFDEVAVLLRTAAALESADVRVLVEIATPRPESFPDASIVGSIRADLLAERLSPDDGSLLQPIVAVLIREGLVLDEALGTVGYRAAWFPTPYGVQISPVSSRPSSPGVDLGCCGRRARAKWVAPQEPWPGTGIDQLARTDRRQ